MMLIDNTTDAMYKQIWNQGATQVHQYAYVIIIKTLKFGIRHYLVNGIATPICNSIINKVLL